MHRTAAFVIVFDVELLTMGSMASMLENQKALLPVKPYNIMNGHLHYGPSPRKQFVHKTIPHSFSTVYFNAATSVFLG